MLQAVNPGWQKPVNLITTIIRRYMLEPGGWILDGFCGSGSTTHAAILCGMSAFCFDHNDFKLSATIQRAQSFREVTGPDAELIGRSDPTPLEVAEKEEKEEAAAPAAPLHIDMLESAGGDDDEDDVEGGDDGEDGEVTAEEENVAEEAEEGEKTAEAVEGQGQAGVQPKAKTGWRFGDKEAPGQGGDDDEDAMMEAALRADEQREAAQAYLLNEH